MVLLFVLPNDGIKLSGTSINSLNEGWTVESEHSSELMQTLPLSLQLNPNEPYAIFQDLPKDFPANMSIRIRSSMQEIQVYLDNNLLSKTLEQDDRGPIYEPEVSAWYVFDLPANPGGKTLKLSIISPIGIMSGRINEIYYGNSSDLKADLFHTNILGILVSMAIFGIGCLTTLIAFVFKSKDDCRLFYLSAFCITISIWLFSEIDLMQFISGNRFIIGGISYITLPISTACFILFLKEVALKKYEKMLIMVARLSFASSIVIAFLQTFAQVYFIHSFLIFNPGVMFIAIGLLGLLGYESFFKKDYVSRKYFVIVSFLIFSVILDVIAFLTENFMAVSVFSRLGLSIFFILLMMDIIVYMNLVLKKEVETHYLSELAYKDPLTNGHNRAAFERDIDKRLQSQNRQPFRLSILDLNNLKEINDLYGHNAGDDALSAFHCSLECVFEGSGESYRFGGDEFAVISDNLNQEWFDLKMDELEALLFIKSKAEKYNITAAHGSDVYDFTDRFGDFKHRVDMKMYAKKKNMKATDVLSLGNEASTMDIQ